MQSKEKENGEREREGDSERERAVGERVLERKESWRKKSRERAGDRAVGLATDRSLHRTGTARHYCRCHDDVAVYSHDGWQ